jgi:methionyl-tRNA formyltransferase
MGYLANIVTTKTKTVQSILEMRSFPYTMHSSINSLEKIEPNDKNILLTYNTNIIIPGEILKNFRYRFNIHAASTQFPGRDPHHWAIFDGAKQYGATLHVLEEKVDSGEIIDVRIFEVTDEDTPYSLLEKSDKLSLDLMIWLLDSIYAGKDFSKASAKFEWNGPKRKRQDFMNILDCTNDTEEMLNRKYRAFYHPTYKNLFVQKGDFKFFID